MRDKAGDKVVVIGLPPTPVTRRSKLEHTARASRLRIRRFGTLGNGSQTRACPSFDELYHAAGFDWERRWSCPGSFVAFRVSRKGGLLRRLMRDDLMGTIGRKIGGHTPPMPRRCATEEYDAGYLAYPGYLILLAA